MEFIGGCVLIGIAFVVLSKLGSGIFLDEKERRDERKLQNWR
jgi:hypothetical protein